MDFYKTLRKKKKLSRFKLRFLYLVRISPKLVELSLTRIYIRLIKNFNIIFIFKSENCNNNFFTIEFSQDLNCFYNPSFLIIKLLFNDIGLKNRWPKA